MRVNRFDRIVRAFTRDGQKELQRTTAAVVGVGGIGSQLAAWLVRLGVQDMILTDPDQVETSNIPRLVGSGTRDVDAAKVEVVKRHLRRIDHRVRIRTAEQPVEGALQLLGEADLILAGLDTVSGRMVVNEAAVRLDTPYIDAGVVIEPVDDRQIEVTTMDGYIQTVLPGETACLDCLDRFDMEQARREQLEQEEAEEWIDRGYVEEGWFEPEPAVVFLNGVTAGLAIDQFVRVVTGYADPVEFARFDMITYETSGMQTEMSDRCPTCSEYLRAGLPDSEHLDEDPADDDEVPDL